MTKPESVEKDLKEAQSDIADLRKVVESLRAENSLLQSQILRFMNIFKESNRLEFYTGLDSEQWTVVWAFLKPSCENVSMSDQLNLLLKMRKDAKEKMALVLSVRFR